MLTEEKETPAVPPGDPPANDVATPTPELASAPRRSPPPGRPPGTLSISELRARIAADVSRMTMAEQDRQREALRAELIEKARTATSLGITAVLINVVSIVALIGLARGRLGWLAGLGVAGLEVLVVGAMWAVARRVRPQSFDVIRLP